MGVDDSLDTHWLEVVLLRHSRDTSVQKVLEVEVTPALAKGENYASTMLRAKARVLLGSGEETTLSLMVKRKINLKSEEGMKFEGEFIRFFNSEFAVYNTVLPEIERVLKTSGDCDYKLWADCLGFQPGKDIYFTDLKELGYRTADRKTGLDYDHAKLVMKSLGKFHAASAETIARVLFDSDSFKPYYMARNEDNMKIMFIQPFDIIGEIMRNEWEPEWLPIVEKMKTLKEDIHEIIKKLWDPKRNRLLVFNHGDFWTNNMMFKYDWDGRPISLRFVDFQACHCSSYSWDLMYLLYTSMSPQLRRQHLDHLLQIYVDSFGETLSRLGTDIQPPTLEEVKKELLEMAPYAVSVLICIKQIIVCDSEDKVLQLDEMMEAGEPGDRKKALYKNPRYIESLKEDFKYLFSVYNFH